jgi:antirestriction protein ArdC
MQLKGTEPALLVEREPIPQADALISASGADFRIGGDKAFYVPARDYIQVPPQQAFHEQINWYRTALHELGHWTGHASRLGRFTQAMDRTAYAREELVAEMCSAFVCAELGIVPTVRHADYIGTWLEILREDARAIFRAASHASKAVDLLLACAAAGQDSNRAAA